VGIRFERLSGERRKRFNKEHQQSVLCATGQVVSPCSAVPLPAQQRAPAALHPEHLGPRSH
jgi:hypothetical protein